MLEEFRVAIGDDERPGTVAEDSAAGGDEPGDVVGDGEAGTETDPLEQRVAALEEENLGLRETVEAQAGEMEALGRRVAALEGQDKPPVEAGAVGGEGGQQHDWRPPRRGHGMPDAGVVTVEEQPDEERAFGPAAPLVAEWRKLRAGGGQARTRVERAGDAVRLWELEAEMLGDFHLTLPPETEPLDEGRREDHVRWREEALVEARRELSRAKRVRLLRRVLTLGFLWK